MAMKAKKIERGFTLIEIIVASIILCGSVLVVSAISTRSLSGTKLNRQYEVAAALADRQLALIDYMGVDSFIESGQTEGNFERIDAEYHWEAAAEFRDIDNLYLVNITVSWVERNRPYSVSVGTMLNGTGLSVEAE